MPEPTLYVTARFACHPPAVEETIRTLDALAHETRRESGCLDYGYFQSIEDPTRFTSLEAWSSAAAEAAHWETDHLKSALAQLGSCLDGDARVTKFNEIPE